MTAVNSFAIAMPAALSAAVDYYLSAVESG
jgi:hypothetical protein